MEGTLQKSEFSLSTPLFLVFEASIVFVVHIKCNADITYVS